MSQRLRFNFDEDILPLLRGAEEDEDDENVDLDEDEDNEDDEDENNSGSTNSGDSISRAEYDKVLERMKLADKRATAAEKKAKTYEDKDKSELQRLQDSLQEKDDQITQMSERTQALLLENTFLTDNTYNWHNPKTAMKLLDRDSVTIGEDGKVEGMAEALKKLADENSYLIKSTSGNDDGNANSGGGASGDGGNKRRKQKGPDPKALARKYPALQGRV